MSPDQLLALIEEGLTMAHEVPPAGASFAVSVTKKLQGIHETVTRTERATAKQEEAVTNMVAGIQKWLGPPASH
jgi:hypothetical protein